MKATVTMPDYSQIAFDIDRLYGVTPHGILRDHWKAAEHLTACKFGSVDRRSENPDKATASSSLNLEIFTGVTVSAFSLCPTLSAQRDNYARVHTNARYFVNSLRHGRSLPAAAVHDFIRTDTLPHAVFKLSEDVPPTETGPRLPFMTIYNYPLPNDPDFPMSQKEKIARQQLSRLDDDEYVVQMILRGEDPTSVRADLKGFLYEEHRRREEPRSFGVKAITLSVCAERFVIDRMLRLESPVSLQDFVAMQECAYGALRPQVDKLLPEEVPFLRVQGAIGYTVASLEEQISQGKPPVQRRNAIRLLLLQPA